MSLMVWAGIATLSLLSFLYRRRDLVGVSMYATVPRRVYHPTDNASI